MSELITRLVLALCGSGRGRWQCRKKGDELIESRPEQSSETARKCPEENSQIHSLSNVSMAFPCVYYVGVFYHLHDRFLKSSSFLQISPFVVLRLAYTSLKTLSLFSTSLFRLPLSFFPSFVSFQNLCHEQKSVPLPVFICVLSLVPSSLSYSLFLYHCWLLTVLLNVCQYFSLCDLFHWN